MSPFKSHILGGNILKSWRRKALGGGGRAVRCHRDGPKFSHLRPWNQTTSQIKAKKRWACPSHILSLPPPSKTANQQPCKLDSASGHVWFGLQSVWRELGPTFKNGRISHFSNAKCSASWGKWETLRALGSRPHMATIAVRQGQLPRVVGPADSCSPQSSPPLSVRPRLSWLTSLPCLTLAGIQGSKPILDGPGWQPLTAQWTSDPQPRAVHRLYHKHRSAPSLESWNRTGESVMLRALWRRCRGIILLNMKSPRQQGHWCVFANSSKLKKCVCRIQLGARAWLSWRHKLLAKTKQQINFYRICFSPGCGSHEQAPRLCDEWCRFSLYLQPVKPPRPAASL